MALFATLLYNIILKIHYIIIGEKPMLYYYINCKIMLVIIFFFLNYRFAVGTRYNDSRYLLSIECTVFCIGCVKLNIIILLINLEKLS